MSDTEEMVRLMEHTADLLRSSMAMARGVLRMVAASVAPEGRRLAARLKVEYPAWAEANDNIGMSEGELAAVARFLVSIGGDS